MIRLPRRVVQHGITAGFLSGEDPFVAQVKTGEGGSPLLPEEGDGLIPGAVGGGNVLHTLLAEKV